MLRRGRREVRMSDTPSIHYHEGHLKKIGIITIKILKVRGRDLPRMPSR